MTVAAPFDGSDAAVRAPALPRRVLDLLFAPGRLFAALAADPRCLTALIASGALAVLSYWLIPVEIWNEMFREQMLASGREIPPQLAEGFASSPMMRVGSSVGAVFGPIVLASLVAGITTVIFAFLLGDEGSYRQHLSVVAHAFLLPAIASVLTVPLKIVVEDPAATLNLSLFAVGLDEDGYPFKVLRMLDLFQLWAWLLVALGMTAIEPRRGFGSAAAVVLGLALAFACLFALLVPG